MSSIRARVSLKADGPRSAESPSGRRMVPGQFITISGLDEINYYRGHPSYDCVLLGEPPPVQSEPAEEEPVDEEPEDGDEEFAEEEPVDEEPEESADEEPEDGDEESTEEETADEEPEDGDEESTVQVEPYNDKELKGLSKAALIERATADGLGIELSASMKKDDIIAAMVAARNGGG
jgi:hypothetical protein